MNARAALIFSCLWALGSFYSQHAWALSSIASRNISIVTGANGYVGREIVHALLESASRSTSLSRQQQSDGDANEPVIVCLVRHSRVKEEVKYWSRHEHTVTVMPYDMLDGGKTLREALDIAYGHESCDECCVYHVASVFGPTDDHQQTALDNVRGTEDLVKTIASHRDAGQTCRLVLTSSMAAVRGTGQQPKNGATYTYEDWNEISQLGENWGSSYQWSKAESERRAWELADKHNVPMVSLCPSFIFGPVHGSDTRSQSYSIQLVGQWVRGESPVQSRLCVDVRDVALAHVAAATLSTAVGNRYIVSKEARIPSQDTADVLRKVAIHPERISYDSEFQGGAIPIGEREVDAEERLSRDLGGLTLRTVQETMQEMGEMLVEMSANC